MERKNKTKEDYIKELTQDPYKEVSLADMADAEDPEAMFQAKKEQQKTRGYFDRLKSKLERK